MSTQTTFLDSMICDYSHFIWGIPFRCAVKRELNRGFDILLTMRFRVLSQRTLVLLRNSNFDASFRTSSSMSWG